VTSPADEPTRAVTPAGAPGANEPTVEVPRGARPGFPRIPEVEIEGEIGAGGMGVVYRGRQTYLDRPVAVKLLQASSAADPRRFVERFRREAKILAGLAHPNIVACHQAGTIASGECYIVMELIDGPSLRSFVEKEGPLAERDAVLVARDVARALEHARRAGVIHRDVKPENVLLQRREGAAEAGALPFTAKLVDLGLAVPERTSTEEATRLTAEGVVLGTPATMAPEQIEDPEQVDFRADMYGLGCTLFHALTGRPAFAERTVSAIMLRKARGDVPDPAPLRPGLREDVRRLVLDLLAPKREDRPPSYEALIARCEGILASKAGAPPEAPAAAPLPPGPLLPRSRAAAALVVLAVLAFGAVYALRHRGGGRPPPGREASLPQAAGFGAAEPLFDLDILARVKAWRVEGAATFGADLDAEAGRAVAGSGRGTLFRALGPGPWRVEGGLAPLAEAVEASVRIEVEGGGTVALVAQQLGKILLTVRRLRPGKPDEVLGSASADIGQEVLFAAEVAGGKAAIEANGRRLVEVPLDGRATGIALGVHGPGVRFRDVVVRWAGR
jgi:predicted Ser/Thr protein kinase